MTDRTSHYRATSRAQSLAVSLAKRTFQQLTSEKDQPGMLSGFYEAFRDYLIGNLAVENHLN